MCFLISETFSSRFDGPRSVFMVIIHVFILCKQRYVYSISECSDNGTYIRIEEDGSATCATCSRCPIGYKVVKLCTEFSDTVCRPCPSGTYNDKEHGDCKNCTMCPVGTYANRLCNRTVDSICEPCFQGYFSEYRHSKLCQACKVCQSKEEVLSPCVGHKNTECGDCIQDHFRDSATGDCARCAECTTNDSIIVPECQRKLGSSNQICLPMGYVQSETKTTDYRLSLTASTEKTMTEMDSMSTDAIIIAGAVFSTVMVLASVAFVIIYVYLRKRLRGNAKEHVKLERLDPDSTHNRLDVGPMSKRGLERRFDVGLSASRHFVSSEEIKRGRKPLKTRNKYRITFDDTCHKSCCFIISRSIYKNKKDSFDNMQELNEIETRFSSDLYDKEQFGPQKLKYEHNFQPHFKQVTSVAETHVIDKRRLTDLTSVDGSFADSGIVIPEIVSMTTSMTGSDSHSRMNV